LAVPLAAFLAVRLRAVVLPPLLPAALREAVLREALDEAPLREPALREAALRELALREAALRDAPLRELGLRDAPAFALLELAFALLELDFDLLVLLPPRFCAIACSFSSRVTPDYRRNSARTGAWSESPIRASGSSCRGRSATCRPRTSR
jgi:hypothetical protein